MSEHSIAQSKTTSTTLAPPVGALLQRTCACGQHTLAGGECESCRQHNESIGERAAVSSGIHDGERAEYPPAASTPSSFVYDFSRTPAHTVEPELIQTKLTVSGPGDKYEEEADRVTEQVMRMPLQRAGEPRPNSPLPIQHLAPERDEKLHRQEMEEEEEEEEGPEESIQTKEMPGRTPTVSPEVENIIRAHRGGGQPLSGPVRAFFEPRFGYDLSQVRLHTGPDAAEAAQRINALAFTKGQDIFFGAGQYQPTTNQGLRLLAHELTHTIQQQPTLAPATQPPGSFQPDAAGQEAAAAPEVEPGHPVEPPLTQPAAVQTESVVARRVATPPLSSPGMVEAGAPRVEFFAPAAPEPAGPTEPGRPEAAREPAESRPAAPAGSEPAAGAAEPPGREERPAGEEAAASPLPAVAPAETETAAGERPLPVEAPAAGTGFSGQSSQMLEQLRQISPVRAPFVFGQFTGAVTTSLAAARTAAGAHPPQAEFRPQAPLPAAGREPAVETTTETAAPPAAELSELEPAATATEQVEPHEHAGAAPEVRGVEDPSQSLDQLEQEGDETSFFAWVRSWLRRFIRAIPTSDSGVNTNPGPALTVELTDAADPAQLDTLRVEGGEQLGEEEALMEEERLQDYGENDITPEAEDEELIAALPERRELEPPGCAPAEELTPLNFDPGDETELSQRVRAQQAGEYEARRARLAEVEQQRDEQIELAETDAGQTIQDQHTASYQEQADAVGGAQTEVQQMRQAWREQNQLVLDEYDIEAEGLGGQADQDILGFVEDEDQEIERRYGRAESEAEQERRRVEGEAERLRQEQQAEQESGNWFTRGLRWAKNKVKAAFRAIARKISQWFDDLRAWVKQKFEELKAWALEKIEQARQWVINRLEDFRNDLNDMVDRYLGRFPAIANTIKGGINSTIDLAQDVVNVSAEALKTGVTVVLDGAAAAIDVALGVAEAFTLEVLEVTCGIVATGFNLVILAVDQDLDALIELIRDLPEPVMLGPLWPLVKAGLIGFLERIRSKPADEKKRFIKKILGLALSPAFYGGYLLGLIKGFVWDGLLGLVRMLWDLVTFIPEAVEEIYNFFRRLFTDTEAISQIVSTAREIGREFSAFMARDDAGEQIVAFIRRSPIILFDLVRLAFRAGKDIARAAGGALADALFRFVLESSDYELGLAVGSVVGQIVFEVIAAVFTGGVSAAVKVGSKLVQFIMRGLRWLMRGLLRGGRLILQALRRLAGLVRGGLQMAQRLSGGLSRVIGRLRTLVDQVVDWFMRAFGRFRSGRGGRGAREAGGEAVERGPRAVERAGREAASLSPGVRRASETIEHAVCGFCFPAGTKLLTENGYKNIEDIEAGDLVLSRDSQLTGNQAYRRVVKTFQNITDALIEVTVGRQNIRSTPGHVWWVVQKGWTFARNLEVGDEVITSDNNIQVIIGVRRHDEFAITYNCEVEGYHTYFVAADAREPGIWVHNDSTGIRILRPNQVFQLIIPEIVISDRDAIRRTVSRSLTATGSYSDELKGLFAFLRRGGGAGFQGVTADSVNRLEVVLRNINTKGGGVVAAIDLERIGARKVFDLTDPAVFQRLTRAYPRFENMFRELASEGVVAIRGNIPAKAVQSLVNIPETLNEAEKRVLLEKLLRACRR